MQKYNLIKIDNKLSSDLSLIISDDIDLHLPWL